MENWIETKVRYEKTLENGMHKMVNEPYLVNAISFSEAEARITEEITPYMQGDFSVSAVKRTNISEIFFNEDTSADKYYKIKAAFIFINERTFAEKRSNTNFLVKAKNLVDALNRFQAGMKGTMADYEIVSVSETAIMDVYTYKPKE
ncbi:MAG: DUF4494 domain-containing protein [Bacteroidales bacterium]|nr:DUF4494 domain-containing protein [Bacteroidales bacterium]